MFLRQILYEEVYYTATELAEKSNYLEPILFGNMIAYFLSSDICLQPPPPRPLLSPNVITRSFQVKTLERAFTCKIMFFYPIFLENSHL